MGASIDRQDLRLYRPKSNWGMTLMRSEMWTLRPSMGLTSISTEATSNMVPGQIVRGTNAERPWLIIFRDALQKAFAPSIFFDSEPKPRLRPGETRVHTNLVLNIQLSEETTLRMPTREPSKVRSRPLEKSLIFRIGSSTPQTRMSFVATGGSM